MNLKTILKLIIILIVIISAIFSFSIYYSLRNYRQGLEKATVASNIVLEIFQRKLLADQYLSNHSERSSQQWFIKQEKLKNSIETNKQRFITPEEIKQTNQIKAGLNGSEEVFNQIIKLDKDLSATGSSSMAESKNRLSDQLIIKTQETISAATILADINRDQSDKELENVLFLFSGAATLFFLMLIASYWVIYRGANQIEESNKRFNFVAKATNDAIYDWNIKTNAIWFGEGMTKLFGYSKDQIQQSLEWWSGKLHPDDKPKIDSQLDAALKSSDNSFNLEYRFKKSDGNYAYVIDRALLVRDDNGEPIRYIGVMQDVTKQKEFENQLNSRTQEAERLNRITVDREIKMIELKQELARLKGQPIVDK